MNEYQGVRTATSDEVERLSLPDGVEVAVSDRRSRCVQRAAGADRGTTPNMLCLLLIEDGPKLQQR